MSYSNDLENYLSSVQDLYPYGIPVQVLGKRRLRVFFIGSLEGAGDLFTAAVVKGMKWSMEDVELVTPQSVLDLKDAEALATAFPARAKIVFLGNESAELCSAEPREIGASSTCYEWNGLTACTTYSLSKVVEDSTLKRALWEDLKEIEAS